MKKSIVSSILVIALCFSVIAGATFALFTSESKVNVAVTSGNVEVVATAENDALSSTIGQNVPETAYSIANGTVTLEKIVPGDVLTFDIRIENKSDVSVSYRVVLNKTADTGLWNGLKVTIDGTAYNGATKTSAWTLIAPGSADVIVPVKVTLPETAGNEYMAKTCAFSYTVEAIQGNVATEELLDNPTDVNDALENGGDVTLPDDMDFAASDTTANSGYGATGLSVKGGTFDGNGKTVNVTGANDTWDCTIHTTGGTIKNVTVSGAMRGIFMGSATADLVIDNVTFKDVIYTFNSDGGSKDYSVTIQNSRMNGWTSFSDVHKSVDFIDCTFGEGSGYAYCRPYNAATFTGCAFDAGYEIEPVGNITLVDCYYNGTLITDANIASFNLIVGDMAKVTVVNN